MISRAQNNFSIKGISSIDDIALLRVQGGGMVGVAGIAQRIFSALAVKRLTLFLLRRLHPNTHYALPYCLNIQLPQKKLYSRIIL